MSIVQNTRSQINPNPATLRGGQASLSSTFGFGRFLAPAYKPQRCKLPPTRVKGALSPQDTDGLKLSAPADKAAQYVSALVAVYTARQADPACAYESSFNQEQYRAWLDGIRAEAREHQARQNDEFDGAGLPQPSTPAIRRAAAHADHRERFGYITDEEADEARRCAGAGYFEATLAGEGC